MSADPFPIRILEAPGLVRAPLDSERAEIEAQLRLVSRMAEIAERLEQLGELEC